MSPEFIVKQENEIYKSVAFQDIYSIQDLIEVFVLLWDTNSILVDIKNGKFTINGGRKLIPAGYENLQNKKLLYARRTQARVNIAKLNGVVPTDIFYLAGFKGNSEAGEEKEIFIVISEDGKTWKWDTKR